MKASEFVRDLREMINTYGDLEVVDEVDESVMIHFLSAEESDLETDAFVIY